MRIIDGRMLSLSLFILILMSGCIHDYPHPVKGSSQKGETPNVLIASIEVSYTLSWENISHIVEVSPQTKARPERPHRFVIEVCKDGEVVCSDVEYLTYDEFALGKFSHKISANLQQELYQVAVWYDLQNDEEDFPFSAETLDNIRLSNYSTTDAESLQCAFAYDTLDLTDVEYFDKERVVYKEMTLNHAGGRFEIIATDIQQFISNFHNAMLGGDSFTAHLFLSKDTPLGYNIYNDSFYYNREDDVVFSGRMRLPFDDYEELKIAEGFIFCNEDTSISLSLGVKNSSLVTVVQTDNFSFPVKRGHITKVYGNFLSNMIDGIFSIDNQWDGEIVLELY